MAALVFKMKGFVEFTALPMFYVAGFVWVMPKLLTLWLLSDSEQAWTNF